MNATNSNSNCLQISMLILLFIITICIAILTYCFCTYTKSTSDHQYDEDPKVSIAPPLVIGAINECDYGIIAYEKDTILKIINDANNSCLHTASIIGYYIEIVDANDNNSIKVTPDNYADLANSSNTYYLSLTAVMNLNDQVILCNSSEILKHSARSPGVVHLATTSDLYLFEEVIGTSGFKLCQLQFLDELMRFDRAYISKDEIELIALSSEYIGFSGAQSTEGAIRIVVDNDTPLIDETYHTDNQDHFTFKFDGFDAPDDAMMYIRSNSISQRLNVQSIDKDGFIKDSIIISKLNKPQYFTALNATLINTVHQPASTFAAPCPPLWYIDD